MIIVIYSIIPIIIILPLYIAVQLVYKQINPFYFVNEGLKS